MFDWRSFVLWLQRQPQSKQDEMNDQIERGGRPVYLEETREYIVVFGPEDGLGQHEW